MEHDCDRYAMKREVAAETGRFFPWSMSDFKPGERIFFERMPALPRVAGIQAISAL